MRLSKYQKGNLGIFVLVAILATLLGVFLYTQFLHFQHGKWLEADALVIVTENDRYTISGQELFAEDSTYNVMKYDGIYSKEAKVHEFNFYKDDKLLGTLICYQLDPLRFTKDSTVILDGDYRFYFEEYFYDQIWRLLK